MVDAQANPAASALLGQISPNFGQTRSRKILQPHPSSLHEPHHPQHDHQSTPSRGSSIGRACGSYDSKEINLKVVGSSPTFGYSYIKAHQSSCSFAFCPRMHAGVFFWLMFDVWERWQRVRHTDSLTQAPQSFSSRLAKSMQLATQATSAPTAPPESSLRRSVLPLLCWSTATGVHLHRSPT